jgi:AcrR family transcriptional regulator
VALQERARATRETIIAGAAAVFEESGYGSASLSLVAERAQVTKGALYFHFQSKEDLAKAVIEEQHRIVVQDGLTILQEGRPPLESMIVMCREFGRRLLHEPVVRGGIRLTFEATSFGYSVQGPYEDWIKVMENLAAQAVAEGAIRKDVSPEALSKLVVACFTGVQMVSEVRTGREDVMDRIRDMWQILLPGIMHDTSADRVGRLVGLIRMDHTVPAGT